MVLSTMIAYLPNKPKERSKKMEIEEIEVVIGKDGQVQVQVRGVHGKKCLALTKDLEDALGGDVIARVFSPEALEDENDAGIDQNENLQNRH